MKTLILSALVMASSAHASFAPVCWYIPSVPCRDSISYCKNDKGRITGWTFTAGGTAIMLDSLAGAPDPFTFYKVEFKDRTYQINQYQKATGALLSTAGTFTHEYYGAIKFGGQLLDERSCN